MSPLAYVGRARCAALRWIGLIVFTALTSVGLNRDASAACPQSATFVSDPNTAVLDLGWTGIGHALPLSDWHLRVALGPCATNQDACVSCPVTGLVTRVGEERRCNAQPWQTCRSDEACAVGDRCVVFLQPPIPAVAGGIGLCLLPTVSSGVSGLADLGNGRISLGLPLELGLAEGTVEAPCPKCVGDLTPSDGVAQGTCDGGPHVSQSCDAQAVSSVSAFGSTSLDCPPAVGAARGALTRPAAALELVGDRKEVRVSAESPSARAFGQTDARIVCEVCADDDARPCANDADCGGGVCGGIAGAPTAPNACDDGQCVAADGIHGRCATGPVDRTCGPAEPFRNCGTDDDCFVKGDHCTASLRRCFPGRGTVGETIAAVGTTERPSGLRTRSTLVMLGCAAPTSSAATNQLLGLPGLLRLSLPGTWKFATDVVEVLP